MSLSHEDLLLLILSDQRWHSLHEILRRHPMMVHSRAAGLREKGYVIEHRCVGKGALGSEYRLVDKPGVRERMGVPAMGAGEGAGSLGLPLSGLAETRAGAGGRPCSPAEPFLPMGRTPQTASPLSGRPLVEPGETRDQEPTTAGSPGVSRTADAGAGQEGPLSPGSTSGPPCRDAGGCDSWGASRRPLAAAPDTVRLQESLPVPGQLSLEDAA